MRVTFSGSGLLHIHIDARIATAATPKRSCADIATWQEAYDFFIREGGPDSDPHNLDAGKNGMPCTRLKNAEENPLEHTPTLPPAEAERDVWSSDERTAELNEINWQVFQTTILIRDLRGTALSTRGVR